MSEDPARYGKVEMDEITVIKVFSEVKHRERNLLGDAVTKWLAEHRELRLIDIVIRQSSDDAYHCLSITLLLVAR